MNMPMCSRCKKNIAVVFITKIEGPDKTTQEGLCLKCARELGVKPLDNICLLYTSTQVDTLRAASLTVPQTIEVLYDLDKQDGEALPIDALSVTECADTLEKYLRN